MVFRHELPNQRRRPELRHLRLYHPDNYNYYSHYHNPDNNSIHLCDYDCPHNYCPYNYRINNSLYYRFDYCFNNCYNDRFNDYTNNRFDYCFNNCNDYCINNRFDYCHNNGNNYRINYNTATCGGRYYPINSDNRERSDCYAQLQRNRWHSALFV